MVGGSRYGVALCLASVALLNSIHALNIGAQATGVAVSLEKNCSRSCESSFCSVAPFLRYGKYCGLLYSGCPGERPCDGLDACCMKHDQCVGHRE
ncbi:phospholipase A2-alpha-like [Neltuma alba]|uniref:phospholipase A2-alpha-like n=1 Tax=Neltuma alba TaxID=207710 RepID=UPI0010A2EEF7|nr:phospholipase A2-alpha-like [Prosopis alba]